MIFTYKCFPVSKEIYDDTPLGSAFNNGTVIEGTSDEHNYLVVVRYEKEGLHGE
jgi:hypothetical protein|tara:strand:- start:5614 stop:5775 length:162 start_codon:yes stop_codon:yes gene_type:complete